MKFIRVLCLLIIAIFPQWVVAQINTGKIVGTVSDKTGASIVGAKVSAIKDGTGVATETVTSADGAYLLNFLQPGTYTLEVVTTGFQKEVTSGVVVNAGGNLRLDVSLQIGKASEVVQVAANPISVSTETSELSQTFGFKDIDALPNIDRNPLYQLNLMPGANNDSGSGNYGSNGNENGSAVGMTRPQLASLGGVDANANSVYIEGVFNREPQNAYIGLTPPIEGIQEVQVYTGKYNAEFGFSGSAVINVITKSGSNQFHGSLFEFLRNNATDAHNYFTTDTTPFQRNQFGGAIGGPVLRDKFFFFGDYQGTRFHESAPNFTSAPTTRMITGDFSELYDPSGVDSAGNELGQLYDPFSRTFDSETGKVTGATPYVGNIIPEAQWDPASKAINAAKVFGVANLPGISNNLAYLSTVRQSVDQGDGRLDFNASERHRIFYRYSILNSVTDNSSSINQFYQDGNADSVTRNQNMQLSDFFTFSASRMNEVRLGYSRSNVSTSNKSLNSDWNNTFGIPNGNLGDAATRGIAEFPNFYGVHNISQPDWVGFIISNTLSGTDNFTWIRGHHSIKIGANINHVQDVSADVIGGDNPRGALTFDPAMTSYDGNTTPYSYPAFLLGTMTASTRARFVQGAPFQSFWQNAWYVQDDYKVLPSLTLNLGVRYELISRPVERHNRQSNWDEATNNIIVATSSNRSPGLNLDKSSWDPRLGLAWSPDRGKTSIRAGYGISHWMAYWTGPLTVLGLTYPNYAKASLLTPNNLTPSLLLSRDGIPVPAATYDAEGKLSIPDNAVIRGVEQDWRAQSVDQKTLNIEREIRPGMVIDIGYLGVRGRHNLHSQNINQAPPSASPGDYQTRRPLYGLYPGLGDLPISVSRADSYYNAITARFAANVGRDLRVNASYAHGRSFASGNNIDPNNIRQYYGPTAGDISHIFNTQATYALPVGKGKTFLTNSNRLVDTVLGGWQYSGLLHMRSGVRFDVTSAVSFLNNGQGNRPDRIGNGKLSNPTIAKWFDTSAFIDHGEAGTYGNAGINPLHGDNQIQLDSSLEKTFHLIERAQMLFRVDAFNTFNHPDFATPDATVGDGGEGQVTATSIDNRRLQLSLRLSF